MAKVENAEKPSLRGFYETAKQAEEKDLPGVDCRSEFLQGLKPNIDLIGFIGMTKVMPCYKAIEIQWPSEFSRSLQSPSFVISYLRQGDPGVPRPCPFKSRLSPRAAKGLGIE